MISGFSIQHFGGNLTKKLRIRFIFSFDIILCFHLAMVKAPTSLKCEIYSIGTKNLHDTIANGSQLQLSLSHNADSFTHADQQKDLSIKILLLLLCLHRLVAQYGDEKLLGTVEKNLNFNTVEEKRRRCIIFCLFLCQFLACEICFC